MAGSDENYGNVMGHRNFQGDMQGGTRKVMAPIGHNRRALKEINRNIIEVPPLYPCAVSKRVCFEKNAMPQKDPPIPVNRRITRRFAAQMASMQQSTTEETNKSKQSVSSAREPRERAVSDAEDYKETSDMSVPMFVQHTEAMLDEIDQMDKEIEMEELYEELELDIDSCDTKDPLAVVEYVDDIYGYYTKMESESRVPSHYMDRQSDINERMRGILIDWLIEVHYKFELMDETLYLTVSLIDRFLAVQPVVRKKLQLVGITAMLVACKYEEVSVPVVEDFIVITDRAYSRQDVIQMERLMINTLNFNLSLPTPYVFMRRFLKAAGSDKKLELVSFFMIELCLVEYDMLKFPPSLLAAAAIFTAQCTLSRFMEWSKTCEWHTNYAIEHLLECSKRMVTFHKKAATGNLTGVHKKYSTSKFGYAARSEPALFLLESRF